MVSQGLAGRSILDPILLVLVQSEQATHHNDNDPSQSGCDLQLRQGIGREASEEWDRCSNDDLDDSKPLVSPLTFRALRFIVPIDLIVEALLDVLLGIHLHLTQLLLCRAGRRLRMSGAPSLVNGSPVHGAQEGSAYNGHFASVCYHPLFLFNEHGDCVAATLRPGNVHSADDWADLLLPEIERQHAEGTRVAFRADAAFAKPEIYDALEQRDVDYAIRMPANKNLELEQTELSTANLQPRYAIHRCSSVSVILSRDFRFSTKIAGILYQKTSGHTSVSAAGSR